MIRTVREYEKSGVAGFHIEDQVSPKKCGHYDGKEVITRAEMVGKIKAAVDTRQDADMVIIARSDARAIEGLDAAIDRVNAYLEAGADVGFVEAPQTVDELRIVGRRVKARPWSTSSKAARPRCSAADELEAMGFRLGIYPSQTHRAAIRAAQRVLRALKEDGDTTRVEPDMATFQEREDAVGTAHWRALEEKYMRDLGFRLAIVRRSGKRPPQLSDGGFGPGFPVAAARDGPGLEELPALSRDRTPPDRSPAGGVRGNGSHQLTLTSFCRLRRPGGISSPLARTRRPQLVKLTSPT